MRNTVKALVASLALIMAAGCAQEDDSSSEEQKVTSKAHQAARAADHKEYKHGKHHGKHKLDPVAHANKFAEMVGLDEAQKAKALALFKDESLSWKERKAKLAAMLTPEQQAKLAELEAKHHGRHGKHGKKMAKHHAEKLQEKLGLTDAQKVEVEAALAAHKWDELEKILTPDQMDELQRLKREHHKKWSK